MISVTIPATIPNYEFFWIFMANSNDFTIADVARAAGVSVSTVSRILNGKQDVAPATRERVQQIIEDLGYSPHAQAQRLRAGKTRSIGLLFPLKDSGNISYNALDMDFMVGAASAAGEKQHFLNLVTTPVNQQGLLNLYRSAQVDGIVLMQIHTRDWRVELLRENRLPFVMIGHCDDNTGISFIDLDFEKAAIASFDHLVEQGHRQIGFLAMPETMRQQGYGPAVRFWKGYQRALDTYPVTCLYREVGFAGQDAYDASIKLLDELPGITAIVTSHCYAALSIIAALNARGRRIPEDISVVALTAGTIADLATPAITHIDFPAHQMGREAVDMLIRAQEGDMVEPEQILISPQLIVRSSTAPAREA
jgi:DNA-binding LacI/PurR family transcriptional regulator